MSEELKIFQKSAIGSDTTQIATQNNYYGLTAQEASALTIKLFMDNFPKLQEQAAEIAKTRAEEMCSNVISELQKSGKLDYSEFTDPDVQFVLSKAQIEYARFGNKDLLKLLNDIIVTRIDYNEDYYMKILLDEAVKVAKFLTPAHLNYLTMILFCKHLKTDEIVDIKTLQEHLIYICTQLPVPKNAKEFCPFLNMNGLLHLGLGEAGEIFAKKYSLNKEEVAQILPIEIKTVHPDYALSPLGIVLAIINGKRKTKYQLNYKNWIK